MNRSQETNLPRLRIVIGAETFPPDVNGASTFAYRLAVGLAGRDHDVHVICPSIEGPSGTETMDGVTVHRVPARTTPFDRSFRVCMPWQTNGFVKPLLAEIKPDLVHVQSHWLLCRSLIKRSVREGLPLVATNHFMPENLFGHVKIPHLLRNVVGNVMWRDLVRLVSKADRITAPTPRAVQLLTTHGLVKTAKAISCGIDLDRYQNRKVTKDPNVKTVLFVGRLDEEKRIHELLRALPLIPDNLNVHADIVGHGSLCDELKALADELGIRNRVRFRGFVPDEELLDAFAACDVFCMPGIAELQSIATMEAMAAGKPVVAADAMALPHLARPGRNGWLYQPGDIAELADRLTQVCADDTGRARMGEISREIISEHALSATLDAFEGLYHQAMTAPEEANDLAVGADMANPAFSQHAG